MTTVFDRYARYYDLLYRDKDYAAEATYVAGLIRARAPDAEFILELGCGSGGHAEHFARTGFSIHGVDRSESMLERARARRDGLPERSREKLSFTAGDVRTLKTGTTFDAVLALFHVMSYQTRNEDLKAVFRTAAAHLRPGGVFLFDFWYGPAVLSQRPELRIKTLADEALDVTRIAEPVLHDAENVVDVNYTALVIDKDSGRVDKIRETHRMRYLFLPELAELRGPEFIEAGTTAWMSDAPPDVGTWSGVQILIRL